MAMFPRLLHASLQAPDHRCTHAYNLSSASNSNDHDEDGMTAGVSFMWRLGLLCKVAV
jgi:hypothetical protein